jgi:hypothetical protein
VNRLGSTALLSLFLASVTLSRENQGPSVIIFALNPEVSHIAEPRSIALPVPYILPTPIRGSLYGGAVIHFGSTALLSLFLH